MAAPQKAQPTSPMMGLGLVLLAASALIFFWGIGFDPSVASDASESSLLPDRIINTGLLATKNTILMGACTMFLSAWIAMGAAHVGASVEKMASMIQLEARAEEESVIQLGPKTEKKPKNLDIAGDESKAAFFDSQF